MTEPSPIKENFHVSKEPIVTDSQSAYQEAIKTAQNKIMVSEFISDNNIERGVVIIKGPEETTVLVPRQAVANPASQPQPGSFYEQYSQSNDGQTSELILNPCSNSKVSLRRYQADDGTVTVEAHYKSNQDTLHLADDPSDHDTTVVATDPGGDNHDGFTEVKITNDKTQQQYVYTDSDKDGLVTEYTLGHSEERDDSETPSLAPVDWRLNRPTQITEVMPSAEISRLDMYANFFNSMEGSKDIKK